MKQDKTTEAYFRSIRLGITVGAMFGLAGFVLALLGVSGSVDWILESTNIQSRLTNATPGVFFSLLGMFILWRYKPKVRQDNSRMIEHLAAERATEVALMQLHVLLPTSSCIDEQTIREKATELVLPLALLSATMGEEGGIDAQIAQVLSRFVREETHESQSLASGHTLRPY